MSVARFDSCAVRVSPEEKAACLAPRVPKMLKDRAFLAIQFSVIISQT